MNQAWLIAIFCGCCSFFSALVSGYVLWSIDQILKGLRGQIKDQNDRVLAIEKELIRRHA